MLFQQLLDLIEVDSGRRFGRLLRRMLGRERQLRQRLHAPQQQEDQREIDDMEAIDQDHIFSDDIEYEEQHAKERHHLTQPHPLVLQIGIVIVQPAVIPTDGKNHIGGKGYAEQQKVGHNHLLELTAGAGHVYSGEHHKRQHGRQHGPYRAPTVLMHGEQGAGNGGEQQHAVGQDDQLIGQGLLVPGEDKEQQPPHMRQCREGEERCGPAAQPDGRRDACREGILASLW